MNSKLYLLKLNVPAGKHNTHQLKQQQQQQQWEVERLSDKVQ